MRLQSISGGLRGDISCWQQLYSDLFLFLHRQPREIKAVAATLQLQEYDC